MITKYGPGACRVCGDHMIVIKWADGWRCEKHSRSHACVIEGCRRSTVTKGTPSSEVWICGEHWRLYCPPRSLRRRAFRRFWAKAKKLGATGGHDWPDELERQYWRWWETFVSMARAKAAGGHINIAEIERMFG